MKPPFTAVRKAYQIPTHDFNDLIWDLYHEIKQTTKSKVEIIGGPAIGQIDWFFENAEDALFFMLKYGGKDVTNEYEAWKNGLD